MKILNTFIFLLFTVISYSQPGTQINYNDSQSDITLDYFETVDGRFHYENTLNGITVRYFANKWQIRRNNVLLFTSTVNTFSNPPSLSIGQWNDMNPADQFSLITFEGSGTTDDILPVTYDYFKGTATEKVIYFEWRTLTETNNEKFILEWSTNGRDFFNIDEIMGSGNSVEPNVYNSSTDKFVGGTNYYRLKQLDFDGSYEYSDIIIINHNRTNVFIHPNPTNGIIFIKGFPSNQNVNIYSSDGIIVYSGKIENNLDVSNLKTGLYFFLVGDQTVYFIKN